ncbi:hypothetical protein [Olsenella porci]|uniref:Uncharacterized protein n=1 Tax=Olsenella porci TaxID=2652279 RepID=A0A6N7XM39_9ACTN|nr:hypothetical protein [Olsenella porci]MST72034.1 hypothetical protein [Olsenella porci]
MVRASAGERRAASLVVANPAGIGQHYCAWVVSRDGSGVTQVQVPYDIMTRNGYGSSYKFLFHGSNRGNGLLCSQLSNSGSAMSTTQRYVVKDVKLVADGDAIQSQDSQPKESATPDKAKGLVVLTGTVRKMTGDEVLNLCVSLGDRGESYGPGAHDRLPQPEISLNALCLKSPESHVQQMGDDHEEAFHHACDGCPRSRASHGRHCATNCVGK